MRIFKFFLTISILISTASIPVSAFEVQGLKTPESFIADPSTGNYFISNINGGGPGGKNNDITLNAPKGLDIIGNILYVSDIDFVRGFDKETGKLLHDLDFKTFNPSSLNDLT